MKYFILFKLSYNTIIEVYSRGAIIMKKTVIIVVLVIAVVAVVWHRAARAASATETTVYCPLVSDIHKNNTSGDWYAQTTAGTWKSYQISFANSLTEFLGAQWVGVNVGKVACSYQAVQNFTAPSGPVSQATLPVQLIFHKMALQPSAAQWQRYNNPETTATETYNCVPKTQADLPFYQSSCPFTVKIKPKKPANSFGNEVEDLK